ncbi:MAG: hypothetical protein JKX85_09030, partial [Phycisphaeraceae bacterium]|nr:hypothetical protein [Phycisphaeraceae bacterium]
MAISETFNALVALNATTLQGVRSIDGVDWLVNINLADGAVTNVGDGEVKVAQAGTSISALSYNVYGELIALDTTTNGNRLVMLSTTSPSSLSVALTRQGILADNMVGLTTDGNNQFFSIQDNGTATADRIFTNSAGRANIEVGGPVPTIAVDISDALDADFDNALDATFVNVVAIAMSDDGLTGYVINNNAGTFELSSITRASADGQITAVSAAVTITGLTNISAMANVDGTLYIIAEDAGNNVGLYSSNGIAGFTQVGLNFIATDVIQIVDSITGLAINSDGQLHAVGAVSSATMTFDSNPVADEILIINDGTNAAVTYTFIATGTPTGTEVLIGSTIQATITNLIAQINNANHAGIAHAVDASTSNTKMIRLLHSVSNTDGLLLTTSSALNVTNFGQTAQRDVLLTIDSTGAAPVATWVNVIEVDDQGTIITAIEFDTANRLVAINNAYGNDKRMMVQINITD